MEAPGGTVLVVDDNENNRDMLARRLRRQGHTVSLAADGRAALAMLQAQPYDLVLLDIMMPDLNGYQVLELMKADPLLRRVPVIVISAVDEIESVVRCIELGAEDYLPKPFNPVLLNARVGACLEKKRLRDQEQVYIAQIERERERSERLLHNILPIPIAERLKASNATIADAFADVTVLFADIVDFTPLAAQIDAAALVELLNEVFSRFDRLVERHGLEKIKTIGDSYMAVAGLPVARHDHAHAAAEMALDMLEVMGEPVCGQQVHIRIGMHSGPVIAGVIGEKKFIYDLWGATVNTASRMESHGLPQRIHVSAATHQLLAHSHRFEERGPITIKGIGDVSTYLLVR